jgi:hypothetical protein
MTRSFIDYDEGAAAMATTVAGNGGGGEGEGGMGKEGFDSGEWIGEGVKEATPASLDDTMTTKPAPHEAAVSGLMPADEDEAMTTKPPPHKAPASGQMPANNKAMTKKPAPHKATASGHMPAYEDKAMTTKLAPFKAAASGQMPANEDKPLVRSYFVFIGEGGIPCVFFCLLIVQCSFVCISLRAMVATQGRCKWKNAG